MLFCFFSVVSFSPENVHRVGAHCTGVYCTVAQYTATVASSQFDSENKHQPTIFLPIAIIAP